MKIFTFLPLFFLVSMSYAQSLPIDFETSVVTADFVDFDGGTGTVIPNPQMNGINTSATVAQIVRDGGAAWAGSKIILDNNLDFSTNSTISMKVFSTAPIGTVIKMKLEGNGQTESDVQTTVTSEWETLEWDFTGAPANFKDMVFMFDFGNVGDGSATSTFLFDDIEQIFVGTQLDLPVTFQEIGVNYKMTDFGGNSSAVVFDPTTTNNNRVVKVIKTEGAATWAGTTIGTPAGFATNIPLTLDDSKMKVRVWSPEAGTPIRLKVEDHSDPTHTCETEVNTTVEGWEELEFDFTNQAPGTELLSVGLSMGWTYNMASIFFNFGTDGATAGEKTYYFDNVVFGDFVVGFEEVEKEKFNVFPNPTQNEWVISSENATIQLVEVFNLEGKLLLTLNQNSQSVIIDASSFADGIYISKITTDQEIRSIKLVKK